MNGGLRLNCMRACAAERRTCDQRRLFMASPSYGFGALPRPRDVGNLLLIARQNWHTQHTFFEAAPLMRRKDSDR
eukprot:6195483-Pleurochrysis_carterae.AAC.5